MATGPAPPGTPKSTPRRLFRSNVIESKDARTSFHKGLRNTFDGRMASEMKELEDGSQVIEVSWRSQGGAGGRDNKGGRGQDRQSKGAFVALRKVDSMCHGEIDEKRMILQPRCKPVATSIHPTSTSRSKRPIRRCTTPSRAFHAFSTWAPGISALLVRKISAPSLSSVLPSNEVIA